MANKPYVHEKWTAPDYTVEDEGWNEYITETAGFVPLEVRFKQMEQAGIRRQFLESDFTSSDLRDIYLHPDFTYDENAELEEIDAKRRAQREYIEYLLEEKDRNANVSEKAVRSDAEVREAAREQMRLNAKANEQLKEKGSPSKASEA